MIICVQTMLHDHNVELTACVWQLPRSY